MAQILGPEGGGVLTPQEKRKSITSAQGARDRSRRGSRESLTDSAQFEGDEVREIYLVIKTWY